MARHLRLLIGLVAALLALTSIPAATAATPPSVPWTWGSNSFGELGDGTTTPRTTPRAVALTSVIDIHGGREHVAALRTTARSGSGAAANRDNSVRVTGSTGPCRPRCRR
jgi:Regulator of chromosome condensation (RCC1) repeat